MDRLDQQIADEADHQQPGHDVHGHVIGVGLRHAVGDVILADVVHQYRAEDAGHRPGGKQQAVNGADITRAEHVSQISRDSREAAAVHADDDQEADHEAGHAADRSRMRHSAVQDEAEHHEYEIGVLAPDIIRRGRPEETAAHVEQAHQADETRRCDDRDFAREHLLAHRGGLAEHADAGGHVEAKHPPDQPELRRFQRVIDIDVVRRDQLGGLRWYNVARGLPARRRHAHDNRADDHEEEIDDAQHDKGLGDADVTRAAEICSSATLTKGRR